MIKKLLCICLSLIIMIPSFVYAEEAEEVNLMESYEKNKSVVDFLVASGIAAGKDETAYGNEMNAKEFRQILINLGISNTKLEEIDAFGIDYTAKSTVNKVEAAVPLVKLTGYDSEAINKGGYPSGYLSVAYSLGFFDGVSGEENTPLSIADTYRIVFNALNAPFYPDVTLPGKYYVDDDLTYLTEVLDIFEIEGVVNATPKSHMAGFSNTAEGKIYLGDLMVNADSEISEKYFASLVRTFCRYSEDDDEYTVITMDYHKKNEITVLKSQYIEEYSDYTYKYNDGTKNKAEEYDVSGSCEIVYNGIGITRENSDIFTMKPDNGSIRLINHNNDNFFDVVIINDYELYAVDEINVNDEFVTTKSVNGSEKKKIYFENIELYSSTGDKLNISNLSEWNILNMAKDGNGGYAYAVVSTDTVQIRTKALDEVNGYIELEIENDKYVTLAKGLFTDLADAKKRFTYDATYIGYYSADGLISAWRLITDTNYHAAFLADVKYFEDEEKGEYVLRLKMYDIDSDSGLTLFTSEKCKLEGERLALNLIADELTASDGYALDTLIRYKINANQEITDIDLPYDNNDSLESVEEGGLVRVLNAPVLDTATGRRRGAWPRLDTGSLIIRDETKGGRTWIEGCPVGESYTLIYIPENRSDLGKYYTKTKTNDAQNVFEAYRIEGDTVLPSIILEYAGNGAPQRDDSSEFFNNTALIGESDAIYLVSDVTMGLNEDNEIEYTYKLMGYKGEEELVAKYPEFYEELNVKEGSMIRYAADAEDKIVAIDVIVDSETLKSKDGWYSYTASLSKSRGSFGIAYKKYDTALAVALKNPAENTLLWNDVMFVSPSMVTTYVYDAKRKMVTEGTMEDIRTCYTDGITDASRIFYYSSNGGGRAIFIFNGFEN